MYAGNLIEKADTRRLLEKPLHPYTHALLAATSDPDAHNADTFKEVPPGEPPSLVNPPTGCRFHPRCPHFMAGLCDVQFPPDFEPEPEHYVACWLYDPSRAPEQHRDDHERSVTSSATQSTPAPGSGAEERNEL